MVVCLFMLCLMPASHAQEPDSRWRLRVTDLNHQVKVEATIRMTTEAAASCMGGTWKRIVVEDTAVQGDRFFPLNEPLAYEAGDKVLRLGRTQVCDGYLLLTGRLEDSLIQGAYDSVGWGSRTLGYFALQQLQ
jgi:hypothetical protein